MAFLTIKDQSYFKLNFCAIILMIYFCQMLMLD